MSAVLQGKHILLGISGGIASYKSAILARRLIDAGADVRVVMTQGAQAFIDTLTELSGGEFTGTQAPAGQLGGERDMI